MEKLVLTKVEIHKKHVETLNKLESELINLISETGNDELMNKFLEWQNKRIICNETFVATMKMLMQASNIPCVIKSVCDCGKPQLIADMRHVAV